MSSHKLAYLNIQKHRAEEGYPCDQKHNIHLQVWCVILHRIGSIYICIWGWDSTIHFKNKTMVQIQTAANFYFVGLVVWLH